MHSQQFIVRVVKHRGLIGLSWSHLLFASNLIRVMFLPESLCFEEQLVNTATFTCISCLELRQRPRWEGNALDGTHDRMEPLAKRPRPKYADYEKEAADSQSTAQKAEKPKSEHGDTSSSSPAEASHQNTSHYQGSRRRRGRPRKHRAPPPREDPIECQWGACHATLQSIDVFTRHLQVVHLQSREGLNYSCKWRRCNHESRTRPPGDNLTSSSLLYSTASIKEITEHTLVRHVAEVRKQKEAYVAPWQRSTDGCILVPTILPGPAPHMVRQPYVLIKRTSLEDEWMDNFRTQPFISRANGTWYREDMGLPPTKRHKAATERLGLKDRKPRDWSNVLDGSIRVANKSGERFSLTNSNGGPVERLGIVKWARKWNPDFQADPDDGPMALDDTTGMTSFSSIPEVVITRNSQEIIDDVGRKPIFDRTRQRKITGVYAPQIPLERLPVDYDEEEEDQGYALFSGNQRHATPRSIKQEEYVQKENRKPTPVSAGTPTQYRGSGRPRFTDVLGFKSAAKPKTPVRRKVKDEDDSRAKKEKESSLTLVSRTPSRRRFGDDLEVESGGKSILSTYLPVRRTKPKSETNSQTVGEPPSQPLSQPLGHPLSRQSSVQLQHERRRDVIQIDDGD